MEQPHEEVEAPAQREGAGRAQAAGEVHEGLEHKGGERPVRAARRRRPDQPTAEEIAEHELSHEPYRSWCADCVAGRGRADSRIERSADQKSLPIFGVDYGYLWSRAPAEDEEETEKAPEGVLSSSPLLCGRCSSDKWLLAQLCSAKGDTERNRQGLARELLAGGYPRIIVRSDGEHSIKAHIRAALNVCMAADRPLEAVTEVVAKGDSPGNGLAEGQ